MTGLFNLAWGVGTGRTFFGNSSLALSAPGFAETLAQPPSLLPSLRINGESGQWLPAPFVSWTLEHRPHCVPDTRQLGCLGKWINKQLGPEAPEEGLGPLGGW